MWSKWWSFDEWKGIIFSWSSRQNKSLPSPRGKYTSKHTPKPKFSAGGRTTLNTLWMSCRFLLETLKHVLILIEFSEISPLLFILYLSSESFPLFSSSLFELPYELGILPQGENVVMMPVFLLGETAVCAFYIWLVQFIWNSPLY